MKNKLKLFILIPLLHACSTTEILKGVNETMNQSKPLTEKEVVAGLKGASDAAAQYLKKTTSNQLHLKFKPVIQNSLDKVNATKYWTDAVNTYNKIPFIEKLNPDLAEYVTLKAMDGLFYMIAREEYNIRKDPAARVTEILKRVFGDKGG